MALDEDKKSSIKFIQNHLKNTTGNGIGDFQGIIEEFPYLKN